MKLQTKQVSAAIFTFLLGASFLCVGDNRAKNKRSKHFMEDRIVKEKDEIEQYNKPVEEALSTLDDVNHALKCLDKNEGEKASAELQKALGKLEIILAQHPNLALIPVSVEIYVLDFVADEGAIKLVTHEVKRCINAGLFQEARQTLQNFASELDISIVSIPMGTYPIAIRTAARFIKEGNIDEAKTELLLAQRNLVITKRSIPLPIIKAQALVDEVSNQVKEKRVNKIEAEELLSLAEEQIKIAEDMGYGKRKKDFLELQAMLKSLKSDLSQGGSDKKGILAKISESLQFIRKR